MPVESGGLDVELAGEEAEGKFVETDPIYEI
jgi:hypothetical protein